MVMAAGKWPACTAAAKARHGMAAPGWGNGADRRGRDPPEGVNRRRNQAPIAEGGTRPEA